MIATRGQGPVGLLVALAVHGAIVAVLFAVDPPKRKPEPRREPVRIRLIDRRALEKLPLVAEVKPPEKPRTPETPKLIEVPRAPEPPPVVEKPPPDDKPKPRERKTAKKAEPKPPPPPPAPPAPAPTPAPAPRRFAVSMEATVSGPGVAVPTAAAGSGTGVVGDPSSPGGAGVNRGGWRPGMQGGRAEPADDPAAPVEATEVTRQPRRLRQPSEADMRALYPRAARENGLEANVQLRLLVGVGGNVEKVKVVAAVGNGFDEAAERLARKLEFEPALRGDKPVAMWIPWTIKFRLDG